MDYPSDVIKPRREGHQRGVSSAELSKEYVKCFTNGTKWVCCVKPIDVS